MDDPKKYSIWNPSTRMYFGLVGNEHITTTVDKAAAPRFTTEEAEYQNGVINGMHQTTEIVLNPAIVPQADQPEFFSVHVVKNDVYFVEFAPLGLTVVQKLEDAPQMTQAQAAATREQLGEGWGEIEIVRSKRVRE
jgi:hypothetical protein